MRARSTIPAPDRAFLDLISRTAFCNPFSEERAELDSRIVGYRVEPLQEDHLDDMTRVVTERVRRLEAAGVADLRKCGGEERYRLQSVFLFEVYHQFRAAFDRLILDQVRLGAASAPVPFAAEALGRLAQRGLSGPEAVRYFSVFYQLRRAYHFIVRGLIGQSPSMRALRGHLWNNVFTRDIRLYDRFLWDRMEDFSTLVLGETGTGKGTAAAAIGRSGYIPFDEHRQRFVESFMSSFVALNLSQFPETLIESELFGHRKGAFTGAVEAHQGVLARCSRHGAIFLDEIGDVSVPVQIKLLQVLQERTFCPVGSHESARFRGRVIAATNRPLDALRSAGQFRDDFFYRLCSDVIEVPPLRRRLKEAPGELRQLLEHVVTRIIGGPASEPVNVIEAALRRTVGSDYPWPGNVRELEQAVRRILLTGDYAALTSATAAGGREPLRDAFESGALDADQLLARYCALLHDRLGSYEAVARRANLDRRTVKRYLDLHAATP